jgi:hypothetical protein
VSLDRLSVTRPWALVERTANGSFPLRSMLTRDTAAESADSTPQARRSAPPASRKGDAGPATAFRVGRLRVEDADVRFLDRTTTPAYSEEARDLDVTVTGLDSASAARAQIALHGILGAHAALSLRGEAAPFGDPFFLELEGELTDFSIRRTNPYVRKFLDWFVERGSLTTHVSYRIVGDRLEGTNDLVVKNLAVRRDPEDLDQADRRIGIPLGLAVSLLKQPGGDIRLTVPVRAPHGRSGKARWARCRSGGGYSHRGTGSRAGRGRTRAVPRTARRRTPSSRGRGRPA